MRVLLVGNYRPDRQFSMLGFERAIEGALPNHGVQVSVSFPSVWREAGGSGSKWGGYLDKFVRFRRDLRRMAREVDLVHILDQGNAVWAPWIADRPHLVTVHDLLALRAARGEIPGWEVGRSGRYLQRWIQKGLRAARHTAAVSEATRGDFRRLYPGCPDPLLVPNGTFRKLWRLPTEAARGALANVLPNPEKPFLLHVGGNDVYKNRIGAVRIHEEMRRMSPGQTPRLVLAGHPLDEATRAEAAGLLDGAVVEVARPSDDAVQALYSLAEGLLFPSLLEGFGVPVLEAQSCGCPVFASDRAPLPEVGGEGAVYFEPSDPEGAARTILSAWDHRADIAGQGRRNAEGRGPDGMAAAYAAAYRKVLG